MEITVDKKGIASVAWMKGTTHKFYEDRYRLLCRPVPIVKQQERGEILAVFDGIGSAPRGMAAAQTMCDSLVIFFREPEAYPISHKAIELLMMEANREIYDWGFMPGTEQPLGGCVGTVVWIHEEVLYVFHAGDTSALLIRDGVFEQLTAQHEIDGAINRYFGMGENLQIDVYRQDIEESDRILLMSDGVTKALTPKDIAALTEKHHDKTVAVKEIANLARKRGSMDDITVLMVEVEFDL